MPYKYVTQIVEVDRYGAADIPSSFTIYPVNRSEEFRKLLGRNYTENEIETPYWLYLKEYDTGYKGVIRTMYSDWGIFTVTHFNDLQLYDFLYAFDHREQLTPDSFGILYELT